MNNADQIGRFFERLDGLPTGDRASLKRACGSSLEEADSPAFAAFYKALPYGVPKWQENRWFCAACLSCLWPPKEPGGVAFEECLARLKAEASDSFEKRLVALLDYEWQNDNRLSLKLLRMVKLLRQRGLKPDMAGLLEDLCRWNQTDRSVQKKWARAFYHASNLIEKENEENVD